MARHIPRADRHAEIDFGNIGVRKIHYLSEPLRLNPTLVTSDDIIEELNFNEHLPRLTQGANDILQLLFIVDEVSVSVQDCSGLMTSTQSPETLFDTYVSPGFSIRNHTGSINSP